jgi:predicted nucleic acid-binding protein
MIIVTDSSPFVVLVAVGHVDVLAALFEERLPSGLLWTERS